MKASFLRVLKRVFKEGISLVIVPLISSSSMLGYTCEWSEWVSYWIIMKRIEHIVIQLSPFGLKCVSIYYINYSGKLSKMFISQTLYIYFSIVPMFSISFEHPKRLRFLSDFILSVHLAIAYLACCWMLFTENMSKYTYT